MIIKATAESLKLTADKNQLLYVACVYIYLYIYLDKVHRVTLRLLPYQSILIIIFFVWCDLGHAIFGSLDVKVTLYEEM